jgi:hypothetical protein
MFARVYLNRLKARPQPQAKGLRCTTHRMFLTSLILAAKYLNNGSPKSKAFRRITARRALQHPWFATD